MTLGQRLKKLRSEKGLTQKDLADQLHVSFQTVSKWENDENEPDISTLKELAKLYGCSVDSLLGDEEEFIEEAVATPVEQVTQTIIVHENGMHVCESCNKDIPAEELAIENVCVRSGGRGRSAEYRQAFYHKSCLKEIQKQREVAARRAKLAHASKMKKLSFGWGIAGGVIALGAALALFLIFGKGIVHPALAVLYSCLIGYGIFAAIYCIISGSYIGDVFVWCASLSIKFPGLIFSWDIEGFIWVIAMKVLFAILGFIVGIMALLFGIAMSALLGGVSFPFVLIHNIRTEYEDSF